jgi:hypothetical protein
MNKPLKTTDLCGTMDTHRLPPVATSGGMRFYGSHPVLVHRTSSTDTSTGVNVTDVGQSLPTGMDLVGITRHNSCTDVGDNVKKMKMSTLSGSLSDQVKCGSDDENDIENHIDTSDSDSNDNVPVSISHDELSREKQAERDVQENWILRGELHDMDKKFERRKNNLRIDIADDDPMVIIEKRLQEVRQMTDKKRSKEHVLDGFKPEVRELIMVRTSVTAIKILH